MSAISNCPIVYTWIRELRVDVLPAPLLTELHCAGAPPAQSKIQDLGYKID